MSNETTRAAGTVKQVGGAIKKNVGHALGNERMEAEGRVAELEGKAQKEVAKGAERMKGAVQKVAGTVKHEVGSLIGNERMTVAGKAKQLEGAARQKLNQ